MSFRIFSNLKTAAALCVVLGAIGPAIAQTAPAVTPPAVPPVAPPPVPVTPPPLPAVPALAVFVVQSGAQTGPFNAQQLTDLAKSGALTGSTMVWQEGMANWSPASSVQDLNPILADVTVAIDPKQYLAGSWVSTPSTVPLEGIGEGVANMIVNYDITGSLSGYGTIDAVSSYGPMQLRITVQGTYSAQMAGPNTIILTPNAQFTMSMPGQAPTSSPNNTPSRITILSPNSYRDDDGVVYTKQ